MEFKYADGVIDVGYDFLRDASVLVPQQHSGTQNSGSGLFLEAIERPTCGPPLRKLFQERNPRNVVIVVEDATRENPEYPDVIERLSDIVFEVTGSLPGLLVAYGTHKQHTHEQDRKLYGKALEKVNLVHHDAFDDDNLVPAGFVKEGNELRVSRHLREADFIIALGTIEPHAFAGFTGGGKLILPGVSAYETIRKNHSMISREGVGFGLTGGNIIHEQMRQAADICGLTWLLHVVRSPFGGIAAVVSGTWPEAYDQGVSRCQEAYGVPVDDRADVVLVSAGGYPKDKSLYQSQRAVRAAASVIKKGGTILLLSCLQQGFGNALFEKQMTTFSLEELLALPEEHINVGEHSAIMMARTLSHCELLLVPQGSVFTQKMPRNLHVMSSLREAEQFISEKHGPGFTSYVIPNGSRTLVSISR